VAASLRVAATILMLEAEQADTGVIPLQAHCRAPHRTRTKLTGIETACPQQSLMGKSDEISEEAIGYSDGPQGGQQAQEVDKTIKT
jgi:hypothetical protein